MADGADIVDGRLRELIEKRDQQRARDKAQYGEERYTEMVEAANALETALRERFDPLVTEAKTRNFVFFRLRLEFLNQLILEFADGNGSYYQRSLHFEKLMRRLPDPLPVSLIIGMANSLHGYVRDLDGIYMLDHGMTRKRVRANL